MDLEQTELSQDPNLSTARRDHLCFGCGDLNPIGLHLRFVASDDGVVTQFSPGTQHQGYDLIVHGGIIAAVLDEAMAWAAARAGIWAVTGELSVRYRRPLRVGEQTRIQARVSATRGRLATAGAEMQLAESAAVVATATAKLLRVSNEDEAAWRARYVRPAEQKET
jgi:acyl-coenzyme A thioesterase PaaI-like protein